MFFTRRALLQLALVCLIFHTLFAESFGYRIRTDKKAMRNSLVRFGKRSADLPAANDQLAAYDGEMGGADGGADARLSALRLPSLREQLLLRSAGHRVGNRPSKRRKPPASSPNLSLFSPPRPSISPLVHRQHQTNKRTGNRTFVFLSIRSHSDSESFRSEQPIRDDSTTSRPVHSFR
ncbi:FMRFamide-like peptide 11 [Aphelenchoides fujianensis]|nr:FMRFamide-like peptide 11 [Aphelenchoides fujianensis]